MGLLCGELTPRLQEGLVRLSSHIPSFAKAALEFAFFTQVDIHRTTACRITEAAGASAVALQTREAEALLKSHPLPPAGPAQLLFSVDGAMVPLLHGQWAEVRTLAVGELQQTADAEGQASVQTSNLSYFSRLADSASFGELASLELHRRGLERAEQVGVVVDGAEWCQTFIDLHAPQAVRILDFAHAAGYVDAIGQTESRDGPLFDAASRTSLCHDLKHSGPSAVVQQLRSAVEQAAFPGESAKQLAYLERRVEQMDYPRYQREGWPLGSGSVESANKLVVEERLKGAGMHWADGNVNPMLALRNAICSDRWVEVWTQIEEEQRQEQRRRRKERQQKRRVSIVHDQAERGALEATARLQGGKQAGGGSTTAIVQPPERPPAERGRPAADHPWRKPWSIRRQQEIASTA